VRVGSTGRSAARISVVVPVLNEERTLPATLDAARDAGVCEVIVVDGGSTDRTAEAAAAHGARVLRSARGRARQMNAGAAAARGDVLLFLHADTLLPAGFGAAVVDALDDEQTAGGRFDVELWPSNFLLWLTGELINLRSRIARIATGDQAIFVRGEVFEAMGGFEEVPLMEDVRLCRELKRRGRVACLRQRVRTSSRRWSRDGVVRTILLMWSLRFLHACGVSPARLRKWYADTR